MNFVESILHQTDKSVKFLRKPGNGEVFLFECSEGNVWVKSFFCIMYCMTGLGQVNDVVR